MDFSFDYLNHKFYSLFCQVNIIVKIDTKNTIFFKMLYYLKLNILIKIRHIEKMSQIYLQVCNSVIKYKYQQYSQQIQV